LEAFWQEIRRLGWVEGKNFTIESRFAENKPAIHTADLAAEIVRLKVDVVVCTSTGAALAAKKATTIIPIVAVSSDPVGAGLVASLANPGGNVTGVSTLSDALNSKRLEVLKDAVPKLVGVGLILNESVSVSQDIQMKELRPAAAALKIRLEEIVTKVNPKALENAFHSAKQKRAGAVMTVGRPFFVLRKQFVEFAEKHRLPAIYPQKEYMTEGGLMYYGIDERDNYRRAAQYVDKILKGAKPADLPVQQPMKFEFIISLKAAQRIGLAIPIRVLERANQVIQ
jgi:putative ABC transport system substrate-binding protein